MLNPVAHSPNLRLTLPTPKRRGRENAAFYHLWWLPLGLGPTDPCPTAVGMETFSTPVLNAIVKAIAQLNSRYCNQDLHQRRLHTLSRGVLRSHPSVPLLVADPVCPVSGLSPCAAPPQRCGIGEKVCTGFGVILFRSRPLRQVSCYTRLSGFQPSWPPPCYLEQSTSFLGSW